MTYEELHGFVTTELRPALDAAALQPHEVTPSLDLFAAGLIDSLGFVTLLSGIETRFNVEISLDGLEPEQVSTLRGLHEHAIPA